MAIKVMADNNEPISAAQDGALYNVLAGGADFVIGGIGDELVFNSNATSLNATIGSGEGVICGRHVTVTGSATSITLGANSSGYIVLRYDLGQTGDNIVKLMAVDSLRTENLNDTGAVHDLFIGSYITNASGVTSFTDRRKILTSIPSTSLSGGAVGNPTTPVYFGNDGLPVAGTPYESATVNKANSADKLSTARDITLSGAIAGSGSFDGSGNLNITTNISTAPTIYSGTTIPTNDLGKDGDIYILYES